MRLRPLIGSHIRPVLLRVLALPLTSKLTDAHSQFKHMLCSEPLCACEREHPSGGTASDFSDE